MNKKSKMVSLAFVSSLIATSCTTTPVVENRLYVRGEGDEYAAVPVVGYVYPFYPTYMPIYVGCHYGCYSSYVHHVGYSPGYVGSYSYHSTTIIHTNNGYSRPSSGSVYSSSRSSSGYGSGSSSRSSSGYSSGSSSSRGGFGSSSRGGFGTGS